MLILALDTTSEKGGVGIFRDAECLVSMPNEGAANEYAITLFEMVERALVQAHLELRDIELYAVANGPGSFTGIRVGLAAARAWGKAFDRPVRGVSVLEAMVNGACRRVRDESLRSPGGEGARLRRAGEGFLASQESLPSDWCFPIMDARRGEFFLGSFRRRPSDWSSANQQDYESLDGGWVLKPDALRNYVEERLAKGVSATCVVRTHDQAAACLRASLPPSIDWQMVEGVLLDSIAGIALREEQSSAPCPEAKLDAYYLRRPDAELKRTDE